MKGTTEGTTHRGKSVDNVDKKIYESASTLVKRTTWRGQPVVSKALKPGAQTPNAVTDEEFEELKRYFTDEQALEIVAVLCLFAFLNRWNHTLATELESTPLQFAERHLGAHGWTPGVHGKR